MRFKKPNIICIIPARGGSRRLKNKNILDFLGHPLISYTIESARQSELISDFYVTTDNKKIKDISLKYGAKVINRPFVYARSNSPITEPLIHAAKYIEKTKKRKIDVIVWLQPNVAFREKGVIDNVIRFLLQTDASSVRTVIPSSHCVQLAIFIDKKMNMRRPYISVNSKKFRKQHYEEAYFCDGSVMAFYRDNLLNPSDASVKEFYFGAKNKVYIQQNHYGIEIDEAKELMLAEYMFYKYPDLFKNRVDVSF